jgi:hypothetical protein
MSKREAVVVGRAKLSIFDLIGRNLGRNSETSDMEAF